MDRNRRGLMFKTHCPYCKVDGLLLVIEFEDITGKKRYPDARLEAGGFDTNLPERFVEKHGSDTDCERVKCEACLKEFSLTEVLE